MKKHLISMILATSMFLLSLTGCGNTNSDKHTQKDREDLQKITFALDWTPNTNHTGLYVAQENGYFEEAGLDVEIVQSPEDSSVVLVASGKAEFGISFQDSLAAAFSKGNTLPITAVAGIIQHNTSGILSRKGEGMDTPKGMEGHTYATWNGAIEIGTIEEVIKADGGDFEKVELIPSTVTDEVSALKTKSVDAIWIFYAWAGIKTELEALETDYFAFAEVNPVFDYYTPVIIGNNTFLEENDETAKAFMRAVSRGYAFAIENPKESAKILCKYAPELDEELVTASQEYLAEQYQADAPYWGYIDAERWNCFYQWVNEKNLTESEVLLDIGFTNKFLE